MKQCGYCGTYNDDTALECGKCHALLAVIPEKLRHPRRFGPEKAKPIRDKALTAIVIGLMIKVYWGGYGPWPVLDLSVLASLRPWLEPLLLYGGAAAYVAGWILNWI
jgi:hypothetical protein